MENKNVIEIDGKVYHLVDFDNELSYKQLQTGRELFAKAFSELTPDMQADVAAGKVGKLIELLPLYDIEIKLLALIFVADNENYNYKEFIKKVDMFEKLPVKVVKEKAKDINDFFSLLMKSFQENFLTYSAPTKAKKTG